MDTVNQEMNTPNTTQQAGTPPEGNGPAGKLFTQDEVNALIRDRLARERAKYADYDGLKSKAAQADSLQAQLDSMTKAAALKEMHNKVSAATGVPADLLTGDTETACTEQAAKIKQFAAPSYPNVKDGGEPYHAPSAPNVAAMAFARDRKHKPKEFKEFPYF